MIGRIVGWKALGLALLCTAPLLQPVAASAQDDGFGPPIPPRASGPKIVVDEPKFNWGEVLQGEKVEHVYKVRNTGTAPLRITNVKPG